VTSDQNSDITMADRPVSPGNTADLIGRFNKMKATPSGSADNQFLSPAGDRSSNTFRKTSAFVSSTSASSLQVSTDPKFRKHSANVLLPTKSALKTKSAYEEGEESPPGPVATSLSVSPRPTAMKKVSLLTPTYTPATNLATSSVSPGPVKKVSLLTPTDLGSVQLHTPGVSSSSSSGSCSSGSDDEQQTRRPGAAKQREKADRSSERAEGEKYEEQKVWQKPEQREARKVSEFTLNVAPSPPEVMNLPTVPDRKKTYVVSPGLGGVLAAAAATAADDEHKPYQSSLNCTNLGRSKSVRCTRVKYGPSSTFEGTGGSGGSFNRGDSGFDGGNGGSGGRTRPSKVSSAFDKFRQIDSQAQASPPSPSSSSSSGGSSRLTRQASMPSVKRGPVGSAPPPVTPVTACPPSTPTSGTGNHLGLGGVVGGAQVGRGVQRSHTTYGIGGAHGTDNPPAPRVMVRSASSAKEIVLTWVQDKVNTYPEMNVTNFSTCWNDGMAFCALIHYFYPEAFDFTSLDPSNRRYNFTLAFDTAEKYADICPLLEVDDMVRMTRPDWKCVFTYVQSFYRRFRNGRDPVHQRSKTIAVGAHEAREISSKLSLHPNIQ